MSATLLFMRVCAVNYLFDKPKAEKVKSTHTFGVQSATFHAACLHGNDFVYKCLPLPNFRSHYYRGQSCVKPGFHIS